MTTDLTCPKCHSAMRSYERNGITIDQCAECRGIFLDRGELERLIDADAAYNPAEGAQARVPADPPAPPGYGWAQGNHHGQQGFSDHHGKRRKGFLGELFD